MREYLKSLSHIMQHGTDRGDRTGTGTRSVFGHQLRFDLSEGFPAVTTKKLAWRAVVGELLWFLEGSTDERRLAEITFGRTREHLVGRSTIWTANADRQGVSLGYPNDDTYKELGPVYGRQWRNFSGADQISEVVSQINNEPESRRIILTAWNPGDTKYMALPPCHLLAQFYVADGKLSCHMYQRSADAALGVPFNIASYALLTHILASRCDLDVGELVMSFGDYHIYSNHVEGIKEQLKREPKSLPKLALPKIHTLDANRMCEYSVDDFYLEDYDPMDSISFDMAI